jgi:anti-sigma regulatory factor (Ser/Thr protein kinase)
MEARMPHPTPNRQGIRLATTRDTLACASHRGSTSQRLPAATSPRTEATSRQQRPAPTFEIFCWPGNEYAVRDLRHQAGAFLRDNRWPGRVDDAVEIVSELVTNALVHTHGSALLHLVLDPSLRLRIAVTDRLPVAVAPMRPEWDSEAPHGWGLGIVSALADHFRCHVFAWGKTVIAELEPGQR